MRPESPNLTGSRIGRLTVLERAERAPDGKACWLCLCDCGKRKVIRAAVLQIGKATSCGCFANEMTSKRSTTHGLTHSPEWAAWRRIKARCNDTRADQFARYGARGIKVCEQWLASFETFFADMGPMPEDKRTIDRIDNAKGYEPWNCRWASVTEQNRNKTSNVRLTHDGRTMTVAEWAREIGMTHTGLNDRLARMTTHEALTLPDQRGRQRNKQRSRANRTSPQNRIET